MLKRSSVAINKKWFRKNNSIVDSTVDSTLIIENSDQIDQNIFTQFKNAESFKKLSHRIEGLEKQNDQLLQFIDFLVENLPGLVKNILQTNQKKKKIPDIKNGEDLLTTEYTPCKNDPCPTRRERDVLELLVKGFCAKEIALRLYISETTVITHKKNLKEKFNAKNTVELISKAQPHLSRSEK